MPPPMTPEKSCSSEHATVEESGLSINIGSFEQLATRIVRLRLKTTGSIPALKTVVVYALTSNHDEEEIEAFNLDWEKF
ncbi:unnamed protein product [Angiostrongylus costaricensis]|uniref:Uncharacterized protein n=1 Tax=Angiostrongylus costaricensis TaxID=334426 RepID=A0A0R3PV95_ANGCS|nr:unnamed protein product [Angiostrongylus costaricensis]